MRFVSSVLTIDLLNGLRNLPVLSIIDVRSKVMTSNLMKIGKETSRRPPLTHHILCLCMGPILFNLLACLAEYLICMEQQPRNKLIITYTSLNDCQPLRQKAKQTNIQTIQTNKQTNNKNTSVLLLSFIFTKNILCLT